MLRLGKNGFRVHKRLSQKFDDAASLTEIQGGSHSDMLICQKSCLQEEPNPSSSKQYSPSVSISGNTRDGFNNFTMPNATFVRQIPAVTILKAITAKNFVPKFECLFCEKGLRGKWDLEAHMNGHTNEKPFNCVKCHKNFRRCAKLSDHQRMKHGENLRRYPCNICSFTFSTNLRFQSHVWRVHTNKSSQESQQHQCLFCLKCFGKNRDLEEHINTHTKEKPHTCNQCDKCFGNRGDLPRHKKLMHSENPPKCSTCNYKGASWSKVRRHEKMCTGSQRKECNICRLTYTNNRRLRSHAWRVHTDRSRSLHFCVFCQKSVRTYWDLEIHMITHTKEKPHMCTHCDKSFGSDRYLNKHKRTVAHSKNPAICGKRKYKGRSNRLPKCVCNPDNNISCNICSENFDPEVKEMVDAMNEEKMKQYPGSNGPPSKRQRTSITGTESEATSLAQLEYHLKSSENSSQQLSDENDDTPQISTKALAPMLGKTQKQLSDAQKHILKINRKRKRSQL